MLNEADIEFMKETRKEIVKNRQTLITIAYEGAGTVDEITDEVTGGETVTRDVLSVVTEISSSAGADHERILIDGVAVETGDVWLSIDFDLIADIADKIDKLRYDGVWYAVMASDKKGIGARNRIEVVGRVIT